MKEVDLSETLLVVTADHSHVLTLGGLATHRGNPIFGKWNVISHCPIILQSIEATLKWFITRHSIPIIPNKTSSIRKLLFIESLLKLKIHLLLLYLILPPYRIRWNGFIISSRFRAEKLPTDNMDFHIHRYDAISMNNSIVVSSFEVSEWGSCLARITLPSFRYYAPLLTSLFLWFRSVSVQQNTRRREVSVTRASQRHRVRELFDQKPSM